MDKEIFERVSGEGINDEAPLYSQTLINFYRIFTIAVQDIISKGKGFEPFEKRDELKFIKHLRNASAHNNKFFWGRHEKQRGRTIAELPIVWRGKKIEEQMENTSVYMDFMKPGDIFILLWDISKFIGTPSSEMPQTAPLVRHLKN